MNFFNVIYCELWREPKTRKKICDLPPGSVLIKTGEDFGPFTQVVYRTTSDLTGWVFTALLDEIAHPLPRDVVPLLEETRSLQDAAQYVRYLGRVQHNLCGELCAAYVRGVPLESLLTNWKTTSPSWWSRVFPGQQSRPTGLGEVLNMLGDGYQTLNLQHALYCAPALRPVMTPARLAPWLADGWRLIVGVKIDHKGYLRPSGTQHWVTMTEATARDVFGGSVALYNPFTNAMESYSWREFQEAAGTPLGAFVKPDV